MTQMNYLMRYLKASILFIFFGFQVLCAQFTIPSKPQIETSIYDYTNLLSPAQKNALEQKLIQYSDSTSTQIVIAIINSTEGENITYLGAQWGQKWGIGQDKKDNGILILLAKNDRKIAINTGYGIESILTDALSKRVIENTIIPEFKKGDYYSGLSKGSDAIFKILNGEFTEDRDFSDNDSFPFKSLFPIIIFIIIFIILSQKNKRNGGGKNGGKRSTGMDLLDIIILSNMGRGGYNSGSSGGGFGSSSGGFGGGFGGGGFGGGGASGGW